MRGSGDCRRCDDVPVCIAAGFSPKKEKEGTDVYRSTLMAKNGAKGCVSRGFQNATFEHVFWGQKSIQNAVRVQCISTQCAFSPTMALVASSISPLLLELSFGHNITKSRGESRVELFASFTRDIFPFPLLIASDDDEDKKKLEERIQSKGIKFSSVLCIFQCMCFYL